jgi:hypothetical protein
MTTDRKNAALGVTVKTLRDHGFETEIRRGGKHLKVKGEKAGLIVQAVVSVSPSDQRAALKARMVARKLAREPLTAPQSSADTPAIEVASPNSRAAEQHLRRVGGRSGAATSEPRRNAERLRQKQAEEKAARRAQAAERKGALDAERAARERAEMAEREKVEAVALERLRAARQAERAAKEQAAASAPRFDKAARDARRNNEVVENALGIIRGVLAADMDDWRNMIARGAAQGMFGSHADTFFDPMDYPDGLARSLNIIKSRAPGRENEARAAIGAHISAMRAKLKADLRKMPQDQLREFVAAIMTKERAHRRGDMDLSNRSEERADEIVVTWKSNGGCE